MTLLLSFLLSVVGIGIVQPAPTVWCWTTLLHVPSTLHVHVRRRAARTLQRRPAVTRTRTAAATAAAAAAAAAASKGLEVWVDLRHFQHDLGPSSSLSFLDGADAVIMSSEQASDETLRRTLPPFPASKFIAKTPLSKADGDMIIPRLYSDGNNDHHQPVGGIVDVTSSAGQDTAVGLIGSLEWIVISCHKEETGAGTPCASDANKQNDVDDEDKGWLMIPAENLISACQGTGTKVAAMVANVGDVGGLADALQLGVDALCVDAAKVILDDMLWAACLDAREGKSLTAKSQMEDVASTTKTGPSIVPGSCKRLATPSGKSTVLADRVCIDLVQSLKPTEGCWLGSSAKIMALVLSEAAQSSFVPSRPFRVNAGPVHSYVLMGDGVSTKYLSELRAGDEVLVFDVEAETERAVAVGRLKEEVRPCIQIELSVDIGVDTECTGAECDSSIAKGQIFVQQAETVRLGKRRGETAFVRATDLESVADDDSAVGREILLRVTELGTHVGKAYSGKVQEK